MTLSSAQIETLGLRPYQAEDIEKIPDAFLSRHLTRVLGVWSTGLGKTVCAATLIHHPDMRHWLTTYQKAHRKVLFVAHTDELLKQARDKFLHYNPDLVVEIEKAEQWASEKSDVIVASIQTLAACGGCRTRLLDKDRFRIVVVDEAHHAVSRSYQAMLQAFDFLPPNEFMPKTQRMGMNEALDFQRERLAKWDETPRPDRLLLGITATPYRGDKVGLEAVFQEIVFDRNLPEMIELGWLSPLRAFRVHSKTNLDPVRTTQGDLNQSDLVKVIDKPDRNRLAVKAWTELARGLKTLVFCAGVEHSKDMAACFNANGISALSIDGSMHKDERNGILQDFHKRKVQVLTNCQILTEGFDEPDIECILHAAPTKSRLLYTQRTGRGTRLAPGKKYCLIIDIVDVTSKHYLITAPTLVGLPACFDAKGSDLSEALRQVLEIKEQFPLTPVANATSIADLQIHAVEIDLLQRFNAKEIEDFGTKSWIKSKNGYDIPFTSTEGGNRLHIGVAKDPQNPLKTLGYEVKLYTGFNPPKLIARAERMIRAFWKAEEWLDQNHSAASKFLQRDAAWRKQPITPEQVFRLQRQGTPGDFSTLTKGQAHDLINLNAVERNRRIHGE